MDKQKQALLAQIPAIDDLLKIYVDSPLKINILKQVIRTEVALFRNGIIANEGNNFTIEKLHKAIQSTIHQLTSRSLKKVINGSGIILHTGLGRAPFDSVFFQEMATVLSGYCNLEFDLQTGKRGERQHHVVDYLVRLFATESALVVNNNAAALILILNSLSDQKEVIVSRGELIEIGGSFRLPNVIEKSGAIINEVGTTNRTHLKDYIEAISERTGAILVANQSNYQIKGFTKKVTLKELLALGSSYKLPVIYDEGSGDIDGDDIPFASNLITCFSGDKLLGGPQSGIILGNHQYIEKFHKNPLYRALRCDKFSLFALEWTLEQLLKKQDKKIGKNKLLMRENLEKIGADILDSLHQRLIKKAGVVMEKTVVEIGSGSLPNKSISSVGLRFNKGNAEEIAACFRQQQIPVIGYIRDDQFIIDLKAVMNSEVTILKQEISDVIQTYFKSG